LNGALRSRGVTLPELLIVLTILGVVAAAAIPGFSSTDGKRLDLAAAEVAAALRYARSESMHSGEVHGIRVSTNNQRVVVYKADLATDPVSIDVILRHPVDKKPFDFDFDTAKMTAGVRIGNNLDPFLYGTGRRMSVLFDASGAPIWIVSSTSTTYPLQDGMVQLNSGNQQRIVRVAPVTGRVTVE
jgi:type II secretion system protein H